ncbi:calcium-binding protein [Roseinatronobacter sp.]|uniref:calcium-binding protein n=1 Tax=Roseinatronobacter sp. TaxID=1945755 RepID=UPI0025D7E356|nr:calcium-binding protein [Roseibaca sp.]
MTFVSRYKMTMNKDAQAVMQHGACSGDMHQHSHTAIESSFNDSDLDSNGPINYIKDNDARGPISGTNGNDHIVHHRDPDLIDHSGTGLVGFGGDDTLEASVPMTGQIHMYAGIGDDTLILDVTKSADAAAMQGHHAYGGLGADTYIFKNILKNESPIVGRLDSYDPSIDTIKIEDQEIDLENLPQSITLENGEDINIKVVSISHPEYEAEGLGEQFFLAIGDNIFYALDGARDLQNGVSGLIGEERHFVLPSAIEELRAAEAVQYFNPTNFVPDDFIQQFEGGVELVWTPPGEEYEIQPSSDTPVHVFGGKTNQGAESSKGEQSFHGSDQADIIDGNTGNDTIHGNGGDDLIASGIDNDHIEGGSGDDTIWGGDGDDTIKGDSGDDYLEGGRGDDVIDGGAGSDIIVAGLGDDTLTGGGSETDVNQFHFSFDDGHTVITDFKVGLDQISIQHEIDPLSVEIYENDDGYVMMNYGQEATVALEGVSLSSFQEAAEARAEDGDPIIVISTNPRDELAQEILVESGFYGDEDPPSLEVEGIQYGAAAFDSGEPGGYVYVDDRDPEPEPEPEPGPEPDPWPIPTWPPSPDDDPEDDPDEDPEDDPEDETNASSCFVATAAYQDPWHPEVVYLRRFRDEWLVHRVWGRAFVRFYWCVGPLLAVPVRKSTVLQAVSKGVIRSLIRVFKLKLR